MRGNDLAHSVKAGEGRGLCNCHFVNFFQNVNEKSFVDRGMLADSRAPNRLKTGIGRSSKAAAAGSELLFTVWPPKTCNHVEDTPGARPLHRTPPTTWWAKAGHWLGRAHTPACLAAEPPPRRVLRTQTKRQPPLVTVLGVSEKRIARHRCAVTRRAVTNAITAVLRKRYSWNRLQPELRLWCRIGWPEIANLR